MASAVAHIRLEEAGQPVEDLGVFDFQKISVREAIQLKARTGFTAKTMVDGLGEMDAEAMVALVWMLRVRQGKVTDPRTIDFAIGDLKIEDEPDPTQAAEVPTTGGNAAAATSDSSATASA